MAEGDGVILTLRLIRSFQHRNIKHLVFKNVQLSSTTQEFLETVAKGTMFLLVRFLADMVHSHWLMIMIQEVISEKTREVKKSRNTMYTQSSLDETIYEYIIQFGMYTSLNIG